MAIADYLNKLVELKNQLVANLISMGVAASESEKLNTLVPKVLECKTEQNVEFVEGTDFAGELGKSGFIKAITKINIPNGKTTVAPYMFYGLKNLTSIITIPDTVTSIGVYAFSGCSSLTSITIPDSVIDIFEHAFDGCSGLTSITIPDNIKLSTKPYPIINGYVFYGCTSLKSITIPDGVISIGASAFYGCTSLESIIIPDSVTSIFERAFYGCTSLKHIYYTSSRTDYNNISKSDDWDTNTGSYTVHCNYVPE